MRPPLPLALVPVVLLAAALRPGSAAPSNGSAPAVPAPDRHVVVERRLPTAGPELEGVLVPAAGQDLSLRPEAHGGEWRVATVLPHGTHVQAGQLVVRFDPRGVEEALEAARVALEDARFALAADEVRASAAEAGAARRLTAAQQRAARAGQDLEDWNERGRELEARAASQAASRRANSLSDQETELAQLEAMYRADELVEAVEDLVLARSRRDLALARASAQLATERRAQQVELELPRHQQDLERARDEAGEAAADLARELELEARQRERARAALQRAVQRAERQVQRLEVDLAACEVTAPTAGWFLHGSLEQQRGGSLPELRVDGRVTPRAPFACVTDGDALAVAVTVEEAVLPGLGGGAAVDVRLPAGGDRALAGRLTVERFPAGGPGSGRYDGRVELGTQPIGHVPGHAARLTLGSPGEPELWLPAGALRGEAGARSVLVAQERAGDYRSVPVRVLEEKGGEARLEADLSDGARVLVVEGGR